MRYNKSFERDFNFYLDCISNDEFMFAGEDVVYRNFAANGLTAKETFYQVDTYGQYPPCREPVLVAFLLTAKKGVNLQIKQWAEGMTELTLLPKELESWLQGYPDWIYKSVINQCIKLCRLKLKKGKANDQA